MNSEKVGKFICKVRKEKNLTQEALASKIHVTNKAISRWERGVGLPDVSLLEPLANALDITVDELIKGRYNKKSNPLKIIISIGVLIILIIIGIINITKNSNSYLFLLKNNFNIIPLANLITSITHNNYIFLIKNIIINIFISFAILIICEYFTNSNKELIHLLIKVSILLEIYKWISLIGIFDINDLLIRLIFIFIINKLLNNNKKD